MYSQSMPVGILVARHRSTEGAPSTSVRPVAVVTDMPPLPTWTLMRRDGQTEILYAGEGLLVIYPAESAHYEDNLALEPPRVWVSIRSEGDDMATIAALSLDPYEGEAMADVESDCVEALPMPEAIKIWLADFIQHFPPRRNFYKRKRDNAPHDGSRSDTDEDGA